MPHFGWQTGVKQLLARMSGVRPGTGAGGSELEDMYHLQAKARVAELREAQVGRNQLFEGEATEFSRAQGRNRS